MYYQNKKAEGRGVENSRKVKRKISDYLKNVSRIFFKGRDSTHKYSVLCKTDLLSNKHIQSEKLNTLLKCSIKFSLKEQYN